MNGVLKDVLARRGLAGLAVAIAAALALSAFAKALIDIAVVLPISRIADHDLTFTAWGTQVYYGEMLGTVLVVAILVAALIGVWRLGRDRVRLCPDCRSEVARDATVCPMCTSEIGLP